MYTFYQYPPCSTCKAAKKELDERGINYQNINIKATPPTAADLTTWLTTSGHIKAFFNTSGQSYRTLGLKDRIAELTISEAADLLASDGMLIKRPLLIKNGQVIQIGHRTSYKDLDL